MALEPWKTKVKNLIASFSQIELKHTWREYNKESNFLSKQEMNLEEGKLIMSLWKASHKISSHDITMFLGSLVLRGFRGPKFCPRS